jgi:hypothetical protein
VVQLVNGAIISRAIRPVKSHSVMRSTALATNRRCDEMQWVCPRETPDRLRQLRILAPTAVHLRVAFEVRLHHASRH